MISIKELFENFSLPGKFLLRKKKMVSTTPTMPNQKGIGRIKKLNSKLSNMTRGK